MDHIDLEKVIDPTALESFKERLKTADKGQYIERVIEAGYYSLRIYPRNWELQRNRQSSSKI